MRLWICMLVWIGVSGCATGKAPGETARSAEAPLRIIDVHTHVRPDGFETGRDPSTLVSDYLAELQSAGAVGATVLTRTLDSGTVDELTKDRNILQCAGLEIEGKLPYERLERELKSKRFRCIKIYLGYIKRYASDPAYLPLYRLAEKYRVPVVFHTGDIAKREGGLKYADPLTIDEIATRFPRVNFVIAHCGNPWIVSAAEVAYKNENVYLDGSGILTGDMSQTSPETVEEYLVKPLHWVFGYLDNPNKLMFGTDWPLTRMSGYVAAFKRAIPQQYWQKVFHDNAVHVFGFQP